MKILLASTIILFLLSFSACKKDEIKLNEAKKEIQFFRVGNLWVYEKEVSNFYTSHTSIDSVYITRSYAKDNGDSMFVFMISTVDLYNNPPRRNRYSLGEFTDIRGFVSNANFLTDGGSIIFNSNGNYEKKYGGCDYFSYKLKDNDTPTSIIALNKKFEGFLFSVTTHCEDYPNVLAQKDILYADGIGIIDFKNIDDLNDCITKIKLIHFSGIN